MWRQEMQNGESHTPMYGGQKSGGIPQKQGAPAPHQTTHPRVSVPRSKSP